MQSLKIISHVKNTYEQGRNWFEIPLAVYLGHVVNAT